jgi:hypothetical protein
LSSNQLIEIVELRSQGHTERALVCALRALSDSPERHELRLELARIYCLLNLYPLAEEELVRLGNSLPDNQFVAKLLQMLRSGGDVALNSVNRDVSGSLEAVFAEVEIDVDLL